MPFSKEQLERYARHIALKEVGIEGQQKLLDSKVLIIGAGGLGSSAAMYLAAAGVGTLGIADSDVVDLSNLQRQIMHSSKNIGMSKTKSAKARIAEINPDIKVNTYDKYISSDNIAELINEYDFVIDATDNFPSKFLINDACVMADKAFCHAGIIGFCGQLMTYVPGRGPCYRCVFREQPPEGAVPSCKDVGIIGAMAGIIGSLQAMEAIKYLLNIGELLIGRLMIYDALKMEFRNVKLPDKVNDCPICSKKTL